MTVTTTNGRKDRWASGVTPYAEMGYYDADYVPKDTDILCAFRIAPQPGVDHIEAAAAVAGESSTATWTVVWTDRLTDHKHYQAKAYQVDAGPGPRPVHRQDRLRHRPVRGGIDREPDLLDHRQRLRLQGAEVAAARGHAHPGPLRQDLPGPAARDRDGARVCSTSTAGRSSARPSSRSSASRAKNYGRVVYEALRGGLDFTKDDENINSQPFMRWHDRFLLRDRGRRPRRGGDRRGQGPLHERHRRDDGGDVRAGRVREGARLDHHHDRPDRRLHGDAVDGEVGAAQRHDPAPAPRRPRHLHAPEDPRRQLPRDREVVPPDRRRPHPRRHGRRQARGRPLDDQGLLRHPAR